MHVMQIPISHLLIQNNNYIRFRRISLHMCIKLTQYFTIEIRDCDKYHSYLKAVPKKTLKIIFCNI